MKTYKGYIKDDPDFHTLHENTVMQLGYLFEISFLYNKITKEEFSIFQFENDPTCGLIGQNNKWCLIGGDILVLHTMLDRTVRWIGDLKDIHSLRLIDANKIHILIDPWSENSAIWQLDIDPNPEKSVRPITLTMLREFKDYKDLPYTEDVKW